MSLHITRRRHSQQLSISHRAELRVDKPNCQTSQHCHNAAKSPTLPKLYHCQISNTTRNSMTVCTIWSHDSDRASKCLGAQCAHTWHFYLEQHTCKTCPKTTCLPSRCGVGTVVIKNWLPLVLGPELAMESSPGLSCVSSKVSSSNLVPYIDSPPLHGK